MRRTPRIVLAIALLLSLLFIPAATYTWLQIDAGRSSRAPATAVSPTPAATAAPASASGTLQALMDATVPPRDARALATRLKSPGEEIPLVVNAEPPNHTVGQQARFWVSNSDTMQVFQITATLRLASQHAEFWIHDGATFDPQSLAEAAAAFDERIYPIVRQSLGHEWNPGVDNNPRVVVLNARFSGAAGYFSSHDEYSRLVNPYSNEREIIYINLDAAPPGSEFYLATLAHEFQHLVHWHLDANEDGWVNEGASELATRLAGCGVAGSLGSFARQPDTQLNAWALDPEENTLPHYGASYLWFEYFWQRLGPDAVRAVMAEQADGIDGFERVLAAIPGAPSFDELFADWVVANLLDDPALLDGRFGHEIANPRPLVQSTQHRLPSRVTDTVAQYATDYVAIVPQESPLRIEVWSEPVVSVVPTAPYQGRHLWWSNRGDMSNTTLTRAFDLTGLQEATLQYALWYDLEEGWDYGYVEVSTDGGANWQILSTAHTTDYNPNGNAFGPGYTGPSGRRPGSDSRARPTWIRDTADLTPYAGRPILVRFEVITDDAVNLPGLCLDSIAVPELGFSDDAETDSAGWQAAGFARIDNLLPQKLLVQVVEQGPETRVHRLLLEGGEHGVVTLDRLGAARHKVTMAISGLTRYTTEPARYTFSITEVPRADVH